MKRHIPNLITSLNVVCGTLAIFMAFYGWMTVAALLVLAAMVFDFFDGMTARLLHVKSDMGKELDSLADVVSFGVVPAVFAHLLMMQELNGTLADFSSWTVWQQVMACMPFLMPAFSAYRLAKFNLDTRQTMSFIGMPTPANALFWTVLVFGAEYMPDIYTAVFANPTVLGLCALGLSILLVSEVPMFSLKITSFAWHDNKIRYSYLLALLLLTFFLGMNVLFFVIPLYIIFSLLSFTISGR